MKYFTQSLDGVESRVQRVCVSTSIVHDQMIPGLHFWKGSSLGNIITLNIFTKILGRNFIPGSTEGRQHPAQFPQFVSDFLLNPKPISLACISQFVLRAILPVEPDIG